MKIDGNLPAYPTAPLPGVHGGSPGMTLRQWYAGLAMQGMLIHGELRHYSEISIRNRAFKQADAMLEEPETDQ